MTSSPFKVGQKVWLVGKKENSSKFKYEPSNVKLPSFDMVVERSKVHPAFSLNEQCLNTIRQIRCHEPNRNPALHPLLGRVRLRII